MVSAVLFINGGPGAHGTAVLFINGGKGQKARYNERGAAGPWYCGGQKGVLQEEAVVVQCE